MVVGAGLAGLSAALHLLGAGRRVTVLERADHPGGRAGRLDLRSPRGTYRVDTGPTVLTMPGLLAEALSAVGETLEGGSTSCRSTRPTGPASPTAPPSTCTPTPRRWRRRYG
ncbi:hypothetical protein BJF90_37155 [Pseudonocardia sp. CNS-004]|nr:hypothetical protein BJF90_37155 [Pseudonocardia sp. CNS-004]